MPTSKLFHYPIIKSSPVILRTNPPSEALKHSPSNSPCFIASSNPSTAPSKAMK